MVARPASRAIEREILLIELYFYHHATMSSSSNIPTATKKKKQNHNPPPPSNQSTSRTGRTVQATARKLSAPVSTFFKAVRSKKRTIVTSDDDEPSEEPSRPAKVARSSKAASIADEEDGDGSDNGETLGVDSDVLMETASSGAGEVIEVDETDDEKELG